MEPYFEKIEEINNIALSQKIYNSQKHDQKSIAGFSIEKIDTSPNNSPKFFKECTLAESPIINTYGKVFSPALQPKDLFKENLNFDSENGNENKQMSNNCIKFIFMPVKHAENSVQVLYLSFTEFGKLFTKTKFDLYEFICKGKLTKEQRLNFYQQLNKRIYTIQGKIFIKINLNTNLQKKTKIFKSSEIWCENEEIHAKIPAPKQDRKSTQSLLNNSANKCVLDAILAKVGQTLKSSAVKQYYENKLNFPAQIDEKLSLHGIEYGQQKCIMAASFHMKGDSYFVTVKGFRLPIKHVTYTEVIMSRIFKGFGLQLVMLNDPKYIVF